MPDLLEAGVIVLGFEGFKMNAAIHPQLDRIVSDSEHAADPLQAISSWEDGLWVDITIQI